MARLDANENFPLPVVELLRELGHDALTVVETGKAEQAWPDEDVLEYAAQDDRGLLTFNRKHFIRLHNLGLNHSGVIACTFDPDFAALAQRISGAIANCPDLKGALIRINRPQS